MSIANQVWHTCTVDELVAAFLAAERNKSWEDGRRYSPQELRLIDSPNLLSVENSLRKRMLYLHRATILRNVPSDTSWYHLERLGREDLPRLFVICCPACDAKRGRAS